MPYIHKVTVIENVAGCSCGYSNLKTKFPRYEETGHDFIFCPVAEQENRYAVQNQEV